MSSSTWRTASAERGADLCHDASLIGRRITVLRHDEDAEGEPQAADYHAATVVAYKSNNRKNKFFIHFDSPVAGQTTEKVDLKNSDIRIMFQRVKICTCSRCSATAEGHRVLPLLIDVVTGGLLTDVSDSCYLLPPIAT